MDHGVRQVYRNCRRGLEPLDIYYIEKLAIGCRIDTGDLSTAFPKWPNDPGVTVSAAFEFLNKPMGSC